MSEAVSIQAPRRATAVDALRLLRFSRRLDRRLRRLKLRLLTEVARET